MGPVQDEGSPPCRPWLVGSLVAGTFLILIGLTNLFAAVGIAKVFRRCAAATSTKPSSNGNLEQRGFLGGLLAKVMRRVSAVAPYPVGLLMGLVSTRPPGRATGAGRGNGGVHAALVRHHGAACTVRGRDEPVRCARRIFMSRAYGWAFLPVRKVYYNLTVTVLSVVVAWSSASSCLPARGRPPRHRVGSARCDRIGEPGVRRVHDCRIVRRGLVDRPGGVAPRQVEKRAAGFRLAFGARQCRRDGGHGRLAAQRQQRVLDHFWQRGVDPVLTTRHVLSRQVEAHRLISGWINDEA